MTTRFFCNSENCTHADKGPFVLELAQEAVMDGNNLATIFCPRCGKPMKQLPSNLKKSSNSQRFYCHNDVCSGRGNDLFYIDLPSEAIMDNNNLAAIFCPKCGGEMKAFHHKDDTVVNF